MFRSRASGIILRENKILLMRRVNKGVEYYSFPGGGKEEGETIEEAVIRELNEEASIQVNPIVSIYHIEWDLGQENYFILCEYVSGEPELSKDSEEYKQMEEGVQVYEPLWIDLEDLPKLLLFQLEIRDVLCEDLRNGLSITNYPKTTKEFFIKVSERRQSE